MRKRTVTTPSPTTKPKPAASVLKGGANGAEQTPPKHKTEASGFGFERRNGCNGVDDVLFCSAKKTSELPPSQPPAQKTNPKPSAAGSDLKGGANGAERMSTGTAFRLCLLTQCSAVCSDVVRAVGLEPTRSLHRNLNPARLPIPPCPRGLYNTTLEYYCQHIVDFTCLLR